MKKLLLLSGITLIAGASFAQSDYTNASEAPIGTTGTLYVVDSNSVDYASINGAAAVWDYSSIAGYGNETRDIEVSDATLHSNASDFPTATHAMTIENYITTFYEVTSTEKQLKGFIYNEPEFGDIRADFEPDNALQLNYPFSLNDNISDGFSGTMNYTYIIAQSDPATGTNTSEYDGNGTLMLEGSNLTDVIRIKSTEATSFTPALGGPVTFTRTQYEYYHFATSNLPVFVHAHVVISGAFDLDFNLVMSSVDPTDETASIDNIDGFESVSIYPNPAVDNFNIKFDSNTSQKVDITMINAIGQQVVNRTYAASAGTNKFSINTADMNNGIYFVTVLAGEDKITRKLLVK
jgi:hypothetical protein